MPYIAVVGPSQASSEETELAREVGHLLGRQGVVVVTGGLGGVMAAAAEGCALAGGTSIGLLPGEDRSDASEHLSISLPTGLGQGRNALLVLAVNGLIAVGGSWGTLGEVAMAFRTGTPVVSLQSWTVRDAQGRPLPVVKAATASDAVSQMLDLADID